MSAKRKPPTLPFESLSLILHAMDRYKADLQRLHWTAVSFGATDPLYRNIAHEDTKLDKARTQLHALFESQYPQIKQS